MEPQRKQRLDDIARIAVTLEAETGLPAQVLIAQWALESEWGAKPAGHANYFGIKKAARHEKCCTVTTHEVVKGKSVVLDLEFADYDSLDASCRDYAWLITNGQPYREAWQQYQRDKNVNNLVFGIAQTYATGLQYAQLATQIARQTNVAEAIAGARGPCMCPRENHNDYPDGKVCPVCGRLLCNA
jgi:flagellum-specific peptidoglycan hydrolase FlgJ